MRKFFKWVFNSNKKTEAPTIPNKYCIKYVEDGNLYVEYSWFVYAQSEEMARYDFWDSHNSLYCDILSVTNIGEPNNIKVLPNIEELYTKAKKYTEALENFNNNNEIEEIRMRYMHGYEQAIIDFVDATYNPENLK